MENKDNRSNWDELARNLGADAPPEPPPRKEFTSAAPPPEPKPAVPREKPRRAASGWDSLAADFGLEVESPPSPPAPEPPEAEEFVAEETIDIQSYEETDYSDTEVEDSEIVEAEIEPPREVPRPVEIRPEPPKTLWERIFGSASETPSMRESESAPEITPSSVTEPSRDWQPRSEFDESSDVRGDEPEAPAGEEKQGRPRRRRRRGGRSRSGRSSEQDRGEGGRTDEVRSGGRRRPAPPKPREAERDDEFDTLDDTFDDDSDTLADDSAESGDGEDAAKNGSQRSIPSWEEAIGFIVDTNLQTRTERRPSSSRSSSRTGSSRGQSRGRRRGGRGPREN